MGLLSLGTPLAWEDAARAAPHVREHGISQFLHVYHNIKDRCGDWLLWGDEVEMVVVAFDAERRTARLSLRQGEILQVLDESTAQDVAAAAPGERVAFHPEYGRYMIESTPGAPFGVSASELLRVERNMHLRRRIVAGHLKPGEVPMSLAVFPRMGVTDAPFTDPAYAAGGDASHSLFLPDELINKHVRFPTLTANIRKRRGAKVCINVPVFHDTHTPRPFRDPSIPWHRERYLEDGDARAGAALDDHIYMDAMGFGMGCCCLQVTFQACSIDEARKVYDQLVPVTPLLLAVSAASPAFRGLLADVDCRWNVIAAAVDDRTPAERGEPPLKRGDPEHNAAGTPARHLRKSRYDSVDSYLFGDVKARARYNDLPLEMNEPILARLRAEGVDELLAQHLAHLFVRDPLVIFSERIDQDDRESTDHFENIQSTNWQTLRFKPPPPGGKIGWRVEFRPMEVQLTDFENAAYSVFTVLLTRVLLSYDLNFYMPLSLVDENMQRAQRRDAIHTQRFFFRRHVFPKRRRAHTPLRRANGVPDGDAERTSPELESPDAAGEVGEFTLAQLFHGAGAEMPGLIPMIHSYLDALQLDVSLRCRLNQYIDFIGKRADGSLMTTAAYVRRFVRQHPAYRHDSVISEQVNYDLLRHLDEVERGVVEAPDLLPAGYAARRMAMG